MHDDSIISPWHKYQAFGLAKLVSPLSDSVHPQHEGSQGHLFRDISLLLERTLRVAKRSSVQLQESFLYYVVSLSRQAWYPTRKWMSASQPSNHLGRVVSCQFPGRYISFWFVNGTTTLHSTFHWPQPCWKLLMYPGKGLMWNVRSSWEYSPSEVGIYGVQAKYINKNLQYRVSPSPLPSNTWNVWPFEKASHSDKTMHVKGHFSTSGLYSLLPGDLHRFRHPFLLLAHPTSDKAVPGKWCSCPEHVQKDTERNLNIKKWKTCRNAGPTRIRTSRN